MSLCEKHVLRVSVPPRESNDGGVGRRTFGDTMKLVSADNSELMNVSAIERDGDMLVIKGKIFGAMPMTAKLSPAEFRRAFGLLNFKLILFLLTFPFRKGNAP